MQRNSTILKRVRNTHLVLFLAGILLIFFSTGFVKAYFKDRSIRQEINALKQEQARLEKNKLHLLDSLKDLKNASYLEKEAREKFTLQKPGEKVVIVIDDQNKIVGDIKTKSQAPPKAGRGSNPAGWWNYFFNPQLKN